MVPLPVPRTVASLAATSSRCVSHVLHTSGMAGIPLSSSPAATTSARSRCASPAPVSSTPAGVRLGAASLRRAAPRTFAALRYCTDSCSYSEGAVRLPRVGSGRAWAPTCKVGEEGVGTPFQRVVSGKEAQGQVAATRRSGAGARARRAVEAVDRVWPDVVLAVDGEQRVECVLRGTDHVSKSDKLREVSQNARFPYPGALSARMRRRD